MKGCLRTMVVSVAVLVVLACLPVIPIRTAPVVPNPVYTLKSVSLVGMTWRLGLVGVSYRWEWYTYAVIIALIAVGLAIGVYTSRKLRGQIIASEGWEKIRLWEVTTEQEISLLEGSESARFVIAYSPDGKMLATASKKVISFLDAETREEIGNLTAGGYVGRVMFGMDGQILAAELDEKVEIWNVRAGKLRGTLGIKKQKVTSFDISPDGKTVAVGFRNGVVKQWDIATGEGLAAEEIKSVLAISSVAYSPDGQVLATGDGKGKVKLWDAATGEPMGTYEGHSDAVQSVNFSPDGQKLASGSADGTIMIWDVMEK